METCVNEWTSLQCAEILDLKLRLQISRVNVLLVLLYDNDTSARPPLYFCTAEMYYSIEAAGNSVTAMDRSRQIKVWSLY